MNTNTQHNKQGFTLIEVIVSVALFTVVVTIALGALFMVIQSNKQAKAIKLVVNNVNLAIEGISRDLRVGSNLCDIDSQATNGVCDSPSGSDEIFFTTDKNEASSRYALDTINNAITRRIGSSGTVLPLTGSDVIIDDLQFYISGTSSGDNIQPYVTIVVKGSINVGDINDDFHLQTTVSQRKLAP